MLPPFLSGRNTAPSVIAAAARQARRWARGVSRRPSGTATTAPSPSWSVFERLMVTRSPCSSHFRPATSSAQFGAAGGQRHSEGDHGAVPQCREPIALHRREQLHHHVGVGGDLAVGTADAGAADAGQRVGDGGASGAAVRRDLPGPLVKMGDGGQRAGDRGRGQAAFGQERKINGEQGRGGGQGRSAGLAAPQREALPVGRVGFLGAVARLA